MLATRLYCCQTLNDGIELQGQTKETEYYYRAEFSNEPVPDAWLQRWQAPQPNKALHLPAGNAFISTDFSMQEVTCIYI